MANTALLAAIRAVLAASPFNGEGHRKVRARSRVAGTRTPLRRVLRPRRENGLLAPTRVGAAQASRMHDGTIIPDTVDTMWGTDLTTAWTGEGAVAVFIAVDHASAICVGIHAAARATRFAALEPISQGIRPHFGGIARDSARGLAVRHDYGSPYMSASCCSIRAAEEETRTSGVSGSGLAAMMPCSSTATVPLADLIPTAQDPDPSPDPSLSGPAPPAQKSGIM